MHKTTNLNNNTFFRFNIWMLNNLFIFQISLWPPKKKKIMKFQQLI
jgi:hypothetical protein